MSNDKTDKESEESTKKKPPEKQTNYISQNATRCL